MIPTGKVSREDSSRPGLFDIGSSESIRPVAQASWAKKLEIATNVAILVAAVAVATLAAQRYLVPTSLSKPHPPEIGKTVSVAGFDPSKAPHSLLLALSTNCHYCAESAEFYKRLIPTAHAVGVPVAAVFPESPVQSSQYLNSKGIVVDTAIESPLESLDVSMTPTVLLIDNAGRIEKAWVGKLPVNQEDEVLRVLR